MEYPLFVGFSHFNQMGFLQGLPQTFLCHSYSASTSVTRINPAATAVTCVTVVTRVTVVIHTAAAAAALCSLAILCRRPTA